MSSFDLVLRIRDLSHSYGAKRVLHDIDLDVAPGQIVGLVGPSGCGKSTLLNAIVGTLPPTKGGISIFRGTDWPGAAERRREYLERELAITKAHREALAGRRAGDEVPAEDDDAVRDRLLALDAASLAEVLAPEELRELSFSPVTAPGPDRGIVYQRYSLYPHLTARENVALGLVLRHPLWRRILGPLAFRQAKKEYLQKSEELLAKLKLGDAADRYPHELSGGMRQRVAIAQALITKPEILLLDEPFGALDESTREDLQRMLLTLYEENREAIGRGERPPYTIFIVTHELNEAIFVGDRVVGLSQYWGFRDAGYDACPGATIVYDDAAPIFRPDDERDAQLFRKQKLEILAAVFDPESRRDRAEFVRYWGRL